MPTFRVVIDGGVLQGFATDEVRHRLAELIGRTDEVAAKLLAGRPSTVKRGVQEATALQYVETLKRIGVSCHSEQETLELDLDTGSTVPPRTAETATKVAAAPPIPPKNAAHQGAAAVDKETRGLKTSGYVSSVIGKGEFALYQARLSLASFWIWFVFGGLFLMAALGAIVASISTKELRGFSLVYLLFAVLLLLRPILARLTTELVITSRRIIAKFGIIKRNTIELNLSKVESIRVEQGVLGRLLNYGDILVIGTGGSQEPIPRISHPLEFRRRYDEILASSQGKEV